MFMGFLQELTSFDVVVLLDPPNDNCYGKHVFRFDDGNQETFQGKELLCLPCVLYVTSVRLENSKSSRNFKLNFPFKSNAIIVISRGVYFQTAQRTTLERLKIACSLHWKKREIQRKPVSSHD
jgi:hypothetical protein